MKLSLVWVAFYAIRPGNAFGLYSTFMCCVIDSDVVL